MFKNTLKTH